MTGTFTSEDIAYLHHDGAPLMLRLSRPAGAGPFPAVVDLHPGAWCRGDRTECGPRDEFLAGAGIAAAALDFRHAGDGYPASSVDINYALRWLNTEAASLRLDADRIGIVGQSSGGHLAMLAAMRPHDPRYAALALDRAAAPDASVRCVAMMWPVINPLSRYRHALRRSTQAEPPAWVAGIPEAHDLYWRTEANMAEGNPMLALAGGERVRLPPALWIQGRPDDVHDYRDPDSDLDLGEPERFVRNYRAAGGEIDLVHVEQEGRAAQSLEPLAGFLRRHLSPEG